MPGEYDALAAQVSQLQQNKQEKLTFYSSAPLPSMGSDGDTRFVSIPGQGLFYFVKYMGHWYSRLFKDFVTTLEDEISQTVSNITSEVTSYSTLTIDGTLVVNGIAAFSDSLDPSTSGIRHSNLTGISTGVGGPHNEYVKGSIFYNSNDFTSDTSGVNVGSLTVKLFGGGGITRSGSSGLAIDTSFTPSWSGRHTFTNNDSNNPGAIQIQATQQRKIKLSESGSIAYIGSTNLGDLVLQGVATNGPASILINKAENTIIGMSHTDSTVTLVIGDNNYSRDDYVYVTVGSGANSTVDTALDKKWLQVDATTTGSLGTVTLNVDASGCANDLIGSGGMVRQGNHLGSGEFTSGFGGSGFRISNDLETSGGHTIEADNMTLRGTLSVYELLIQQIRATNGSLFISSCGKIDSITTDTVGSEVIVMEDPGGHGAAPFIVDDIIIVQRVKLAGTTDTSSDIIKRIVRTVEAVSGLNVTLTTAGLTGWATSDDAGVYEIGDDLIRLGNSSEDSRQASIKLTADENNSPYMDLKNDVTSWTSWLSPDTTKLRLGNLAGISNMAGDGTLTGYGLWSDNVYLKGEMRATSGYIGSAASGWTINDTGITNDSGSALIALGADDSGNYNYNDSDTHVYFDGTGQFSLGDSFRVASNGDVYLSASATEYIKASSAGIQLYGAGNKYISLTSTGIDFVNLSITTMSLNADGSSTFGQVATGKSNMHVTLGGILKLRGGADGTTNTISMDGDSGLITLQNGITSSAATYAEAEALTSSNLFLGGSSLDSKFFIGKSNAGYMKWTGTELFITDATIVGVLDAQKLADTQVKIKNSHNSQYSPLIETYQFFDGAGDSADGRSVSDASSQSFTVSVRNGSRVAINVRTEINGVAGSGVYIPTIRWSKNGDSDYFYVRPDGRPTELFFTPTPIHSITSPADSPSNDNYIHVNLGAKSASSNPKDMWTYDGFNINDTDHALFVPTVPGTLKSELSAESQQYVTDIYNPSHMFGINPSGQLGPDDDTKIWYVMGWNLEDSVLGDNSYGYCELNRSLTSGSGNRTFEYPQAIVNNNPVIQNVYEAVPAGWASGWSYYSSVHRFNFESPIGTGNIIGNSALHSSYEVSIIPFSFNAFYLDYLNQTLYYTYYIDVPVDMFSSLDTEGTIKMALGMGQPWGSAHADPVFKSVNFSVQVFNNG
jgi:hypothetical protein